MGSFLNAIVAQLVECRPSKAKVEGSRPFYRSKKVNVKNHTAIIFIFMGQNKKDSC